MNKDCDKMTPLELAKALIYNDIVNGATIQQIKAGQQGSYGHGYNVQVGGWIWNEDNKGQKTSDKRIPTDKIVVREANGKLINKIFSLKEIYNLIKKELEQPTLL